MQYRCPHCGYKAVEYSTEVHPCPICGERYLFFTHISINKNFYIGTHEVMIDTKTNTLIGIDPCDERT